MGNKEIVKFRLPDGEHADRVVSVVVSETNQVYVTGLDGVGELEAASMLAKGIQTLMVVLNNNIKKVREAKKKEEPRIIIPGLNSVKITNIRKN